MSNLQSIDARISGRIKRPFFPHAAAVAQLNGSAQSTRTIFNQDLLSEAPLLNVKFSNESPHNQSKIKL